MVTKRRRSKSDESASAPPSLTMAKVLRKLARGEELVGTAASARWKGRLKALCDSLEVVEEPRDIRGRKHPLKTVLTVAVLGSMCGADSADSMHIWALREREWLEEFVAFPSGVPSQDTILRVLAAVDPMGLRLAYLRWVKAVLGPNVARGAQVAIDGKTLRRSGGGRGQDKPVHMVSALVSGLNLVIGQRSCDEKSNEITAIPKLLELLSLREALVSIDAMGCQVAIAEKILSRQADYLLALKGNQGLLHEQVRTAFAAIDAGPPRAVDAAQPLKASKAASFDSGHGRHEERVVCMVSRASNEGEFERWLPASCRWPGLEAIICIREKRENATTGGVSSEQRFFITSKDMSAEDALAAIRAHWAIENGLHWVLDVCFAEDQSRVRTENAGENLAVIRHLAHALLRRHTADSVSVAKRRELCMMWRSYLEFVLGSACEEDA